MWRIVVTTYNALKHGSHSFTCKWQHACLYFPAAEHHCPLAGTHFIVPRRVKGWVDLGGWLRTEIKCHQRESNPDTVTHPSTNRAQRRLTSLIETNDASTYATPPPPLVPRCRGVGSGRGCYGGWGVKGVSPPPLGVRSKEESVLPP